MNCIITDFQDRADFVEAAVRRIAAEAEDAVRERGRFVLALSGGSTPRDIYAGLAAGSRGKAFPWERTLFVFGDERMVSHKDPLSNFRMVWDTMLAKVPVPAANILPVRAGEGSPADVARKYEEALRTLLEAPGGIPVIDLVLLGMGPDGHTASLFPGADALNERERLIMPVPAPDMEPRVPRVTMTLPLISGARQVLFLTGRQGREAALDDVLRGGSDLPASRVEGKGPEGRSVEWYILERG